ncbi:MAG: cysteine desulfurase family protein [Rhabdochlamydiaceae bacterium]|jgi:cysteine desulfurase
MKKIYLDNNGTTGLDPRVAEAMVEVLTPIPINPSSVHAFGQEAKRYITRSRDTIAHALHVKPSELIFTSGGTEALNFLIRGFYALSPGSHIISSNVEHPAVRLTLADLERVGAHVTYLEAGLWGAIRPEQLEAAITPKTRLIALMAVNNITGVKTDLEAIAAIADRHQIPLVVDGVQLLGKEQVRMPRGISGMAFSSHKIHGPQGVGAAILRSHYKLPPLITGGAQESGRRGGTENIPGIVGFAKAVELLDPKATQQMQKLRDRLIEGVSHAAGNIVVHGQGPRVCNTAHIGFPGIDAETLLIQLDLAGVAASHGSACASGGLEPSPILLQMGIPASLAASSIRFSLSRFTTQDEIDTTIDLISQLIKRS